MTSARTNTVLPVCPVDASSTVSQQCWNETAYDWLLRSRQAKRRCCDSIENGSPPKDPSSAAWCFVQPYNTTKTSNNNRVLSNNNNNDTNSENLPFSSRKSSTNYDGGTGIAFIDAVLNRPMVVSTAAVAALNHQQEPYGGYESNFRIKSNKVQLPVIDIRGDVGKSWTLISLAARFVVSTRPSQFNSFYDNNNNDSTVSYNNQYNHHCNSDDGGSGSVVPSSALPQVIVLDSTFDITATKVAYAVRATLIRTIVDDDNIQAASTSKSTGPGTGTSTNDNDNTADIAIESDMDDCLRRIHIATPSNDSMTSSWITVLESIRCQLIQNICSDHHPTLILWDGFLSEPGLNDATKMEIVRQLERLLNECSILLVLSTPTTGSIGSSTSIQQCSTYRKREWERFITHRIRLDRNTDVDGGSGGDGNPQHMYVATVYGSRIPFSISLAGILS